MLKKLIIKLSKNARTKRAKTFLENFELNEDTKILDFGSENGSAINSILKNSRIRPENVYIADINEEAVLSGHCLFGYTPVKIKESGVLKYPDKFFDIVYCSSVIEHVTIPKDLVWTTLSSKEFKKASFQRQYEFAAEIRRLGKAYYVQTPNKYFLIESHSWLPMLGYLPRFILLPVLKLTNKIWIKKTQPDWNLLTRKELAYLFPGCSILTEKFAGFSKSIVAIKNIN